MDLGINSFIDELAIKAGKDPLAFHLDLLGKDRIEEGKSDVPFNSGRLKNVLKTVAQKANWGEETSQRSRIRMAVHYSFYSYVATVVEVSTHNEKIKVENIWTTIDCGTGAKQRQCDQSIRRCRDFGMSLAMFGKITTEGGAIEQSNFHDYPMTRMKDAPNIDVTVINNMETAPTGVGEPGVPVIALRSAMQFLTQQASVFAPCPLTDHGLI